jgi:hypothetical protein
LALHADKIPLVEPDFPGLRFIRHIKSTGEYKKGVVSLFTIKHSKNKSAYMQALMPGVADRSYFSGLSPMAESALAPYDSLPLPTLVVHQSGEAAKVPFVSVFEPFVGKDNYTVQAVEWLNRTFKGNLTALRISCKDDLTYWVMNATDASRKGTLPDGSFTGTYASIEFRKDTIYSIYLGKGLQLECRDFSVKGETSECSANITFGDRYLDITTTQPLQISWKGSQPKHIYLVEKGSETRLTITKPRRSNFYQIPVVKEARVYFYEE